MSEHIEINGIKLLPIKDTAEAVSYSRDYVARLAREQKIVASQVGRQWYVDLLSLKSFSEIAEMESSVRKQQLSQERKREKDLKDQLAEIKSHLKVKSKAVRPRARVMAVSVLAFGLLAGTGLYSALSFFPQHANDISLARVITDKKVPEIKPVVENELKVIDPELDLHQVAVVTQISEIPVFTEEVDIRFLSADTNNGILLLPKKADSETKTEIPELFSDYVIVNFVDEDRGVVVYDKDGKVTELPFVAVPVDAGEGSLSEDKALNQ